MSKILIQKTVTATLELSEKELNGLADILSYGLNESHRKKFNVQELFNQIKEFSSSQEKTSIRNTLHDTSDN